MPLKTRTFAVALDGPPATWTVRWTVHSVPRASPRARSSWLGLDTAELYQGGLLAEIRPAAGPAEGGTVWVDEVLTLAPEADTIFVVITRGPERGSPVFGGFTFAMSGPTPRH